MLKYIKTMTQKHNKYVNDLHKYEILILLLYNTHIH